MPISLNTSLPACSVFWLDDQVYKKLNAQIIDAFKDVSFKDASYIDLKISIYTEHFSSRVTDETWEQYNARRQKRIEQRSKATKEEDSLIDALKGAANIKKQKHTKTFLDFTGKSFPGAVGSAYLWD